jgi:hypothetical protein
MKAEDRVQLILNVYIEDDDSRDFVESFIRNSQSELKKEKEKNELLTEFKDSIIRLSFKALNVYDKLYCIKDRIELYKELTKNKDEN